MENPKLPPPIFEPFDIEEFITKQKEYLEQAEKSDPDKMLANVIDGKQGNGFVFTYNNFTHTPQELIELLSTLPNIVYIKFQIEKGQSGTVHYQGYTHFSKRVYWGQFRRNTIKMGLHRMRHENRIKSSQQASDYCHKDYQELKPSKPYDNKLTIHTCENGNKWFQTKLTPEVYTWGELPPNEQGKRTDIINLMEDIYNGYSLDYIRENYTALYYRDEKKIIGHRQSYLRKKFGSVWRDVKVVYIYGETRTKKTRSLADKYGYSNFYRTINYKNPFDKYDGQDILVLDEYRGEMDMSILLGVLEGHPLELPSRYEDRVACYTKVYVVANEPLDEQHRDVQATKPKTWQALLKRINGWIYNFNIPRHKEMFFNEEHPNPTVEQTGMTIITDPKELKKMPF